MKLDHYHKTLLLPYTRLFVRCQLVDPDFRLEPHIRNAICDPHPRIVLLSRRFNDLEDSRNMVQAYTSLLDSHYPIGHADLAQFLGFIQPLVVPGCEDLIFDMFNASMQLLWNLFSTTPEPVVDAATLKAVLIYFR